MIDGVFIPLPRFRLRLLGAPAESAHHPPDVAGVITHSGQAGDDLGDTGQAPQFRLQPVGLGSFQESRFDHSKLRSSQPRLAAGAASARERPLAALIPMDEPNVNGLARHSQPTSHLGLGDTLFEKVCRLQPPALHAAEIAPGTVLRDVVCFHAVSIRMEPILVNILCESQ